MRTTTTSNVFPIDFFDFNKAPTIAQLEQELKRVRASLSDSMGAFKEHLAKHGLCPDQIVPDGKRHRFPVDGDTGNEQSGWYIFYGDNWPAGAFGCWRGSLSIDKAQSTWAADRPLDDSSPADDAARRERIAEMSRIREEQQQAFYAEGRERASEIWSSAREAESHPYLTAKGVQGHSLRVERGALCIPAYTIDGTLRGLQRIYWDAKDGKFAKRFSEGTEKRGSFAHIPGEKDRIIIGEGYATMATVREATGATCIVAWDCGNLTNVAKAWRERLPDATIIIAGDNDPNGTGQRTAKEAADAIGARCIIVDVSEVPGATDFNDVAAAKGIEEVTRQFESVKTAFGIARYAGSIAYLGEPTPIEWVVDGLFQKGAVSLIAGVGAAGKSMLMLDLCAKVGMPPVDSGESVIDLNWHTSLGNRVMSHGKAVVISAEDGRDELHRRVHALGYRGEQLGNVYLFPVPDEGGCKILMSDDRRTNTIVTTPDWHALRRELHQIKPEILIIDPLASFVSADLDKDNRAGQQVMGMFDALARELNCAVVVVHHFAKGDRQPKSADEALKLVRGATALINRCRTVYVLWQAGKEGRALAVERVGECLAKDDVYQGCAAKQNTKGDKRTKVLLRSKDRAVLEVIATLEDSEGACSAVAKVDRLLVEFIASETEATGRPFTKTGDAGPYARAKVKQSAGDKSPMVQAVASIGRNEMGARIDALVDQGALVTMVAIKPQSGVKKDTRYYDAPNGALVRSGEYIESV